jgi:hypothetical protein
MCKYLPILEQRAVNWGVRGTKKKVGTTGRWAAVAVDMAVPHELCTDSFHESSRLS